jgi:hypothetical protein
MIWFIYQFEARREAKVSDREFLKKVRDSVLAERKTNHPPESVFHIHYHARSGN